MAVIDGGVYSIRLNGREMELLRSFTDRDTDKISDLIHEALRRCMGVGMVYEPTVHIDTSQGGKVFVYKGGPSKTSSVSIVADTEGSVPMITGSSVMSYTFAP